MDPTVYAVDLAHLDVFIVGTFVIRFANALAWTIVCVEILRYQRTRAMPPLVRQLIVSVLIFGMWVLVLGSLVQVGFPGDSARTIYTVFTAYSAIIAIGILSSNVLD